MNNIEIHCSEIPKWAACAKSAQWKMNYPEKRQERLPHIATYIGSYVHATLADLEPPDGTGMFVFDKITPDMNYARVQAKRMTEAVRAWLGDCSDIDFEVNLGTMREVEWPDNMVLTGTADMILATPEGRLAVLDLKTSRNIEAAWLQLGGYAKLLNSRVHRVDLVGVLHCPRGHLQEELNVTATWREAGPALDEADLVLKNISRSFMGWNMAASPGPACRYCPHPDCVVRAGEQDIHL